MSRAIGTESERNWVTVKNAVDSMVQLIFIILFSPFLSQFLFQACYYLLTLIVIILSQ